MRKFIRVRDMYQQIVNVLRGISNLSVEEERVQVLSLLVGLVAVLLLHLRLVFVLLRV